MVGIPNFGLVKRKLHGLNLGKSGYGFYIWHDENGHYVEDITIGSPADRAGLRAGDRIIEINNGEQDFLEAIFRLSFIFSEYRKRINRRCILSNQSMS